jgi:hypothetical protein
MKQPGAVLIAVALCFVWLAAPAHATELQPVPAKAGTPGAAGTQQAAMGATATGGNKQEAVRGEGEGRTQQQPQPAANFLQHPYAITCKVAVQAPRWEATPTGGNKQGPRWEAKPTEGNKQYVQYAPGTLIPVPAGKKPADICPETAIRSRFWRIPLIRGAPPPLKLTSSTTGKPP